MTSARSLGVLNTAAAVAVFYTYVCVRFAGARLVLPMNSNEQSENRSTPLKASQSRIINIIRSSAAFTRHVEKCFVATFAHFVTGCCSCVLY